MLFPQDESEEAQPLYYKQRNPPSPPVTLDLFETKTRTVLVIEKDSSVRDWIQYILQTEQLRVIFANDTSSGLESIKVHSPHLILLSVQLARVDHYLLCRLIRKNPDLARLPVIILGERVNSPVDVVRGRLYGSTDFLSKPSDSQQLVQMVKKYLPAAE